MEYKITNNNEVNQAKELIILEASSKNGLQSLFKSSADIESDRITNFISALQILSQHYKKENSIEKPIAKRLHNYYITLKESEKNWIKRWPKGYEYNTLTSIYTNISNVFIS